MHQESPSGLHVAGDAVSHLSTAFRSSSPKPAPCSAPRAAAASEMVSAGAGSRSARYSWISWPLAKVREKYSIAESEGEQPNFKVIGEGQKGECAAPGTAGSRGPCRTGGEAGSGQQVSQRPCGKGL